ncbi:(Fe-S)-binding protein [Gemmatirosa kalamazoonensis]|uniref:(Fe-S)-binding protein n=1 Tax=Gemmatirosa kalamazoonensis TaxID=861299 RepID=UPI00130E7615|nr:heterodisulfide reductase-related iron-sulfur binding cluster [Gemmatirosa kalamazoonensis]
MLLPNSTAPCALPDSPLAAAKPGIDACVHCGFCLQACPTYVNLEDENDSPRGRILLMRSVLEGTLPADDADVRTHIDRCLGCRACETACPSGVPYGHMLEAMRATLYTRQPPPLVARVILAVFARRALLSLALLGARVLRATRLPRLLSRLPGRMGFAFAMLASTEAPLRGRRWTPRGTGARGTATLLEGCVMRGLFRHTNAATKRVLRENDYALADTRGQACCGALHAHAGDLDAARALARANVAAFERSSAEWIVVNSAGCGAMMKEYGELLADDPAWSARARAVAERVRDVSELLVAAGPRPTGGPVLLRSNGGGTSAPLRVTYDAPCHLLHAQRVSLPPLQVLGAVRGVDLVALTDSDQCCGSAGIYNLVEPDTSDAVLAPKLAHIAATGAALVATGNPGCLMQLGAGLRRAGAHARVLHPVDLLDAAYASGERAAPA